MDLRQIFAVLILSAPTFVGASPGKPVPIKLDDGVVLAGTYYAAARPGPAVLFLNMCDPARDQSEWNGVARTLSDDGYHVLTFDYRGFGTSGGEMPTGLNTIEEAMHYWREHWMTDVQAAFDTLSAQPGVQIENVAVAGASCGVFMGLEFTLENENVRSFTGLGGPTQQVQRDRLKKREDLPVLIIAGNEGPIHEWSDPLYAATTHRDSRMIKYNVVTYGTKIFDYEPGPARMLVQWIKDTVPK